ncbi:hypothetical protein Taro_025998, partial [Colocasia esculenta]|nr:hypothetical protein [Colocasia esculenta]
MDAVGVVGRSPLSTVSSHPRRSALLRSQHLSALHASSSLSLALGPCIHGGAMRAELPRRRSKARIFLPHLVAAMEQVEETYIMVKPDGVQRGLVGEIISRFEKKGFLLKGLKLFQCPTELAE